MSQKAAEGTQAVIHNDTGKLREKSLNKNSANKEQTVYIWH